MPVILSLLIEMIPLVLIVLWVCRIKTGEKFPRKTVAKFLIAGGLSLLLSIVAASPVYLAMKDVTDMNPLLKGLILTLLTAAIPEELAKYLMFRVAIRKEKSVRVWFDAVLACGLVGMGFVFLEDLEYLLSDGGAMMIRGLLPFHFIFQVIMGYYYGKYVVTGEKQWHIRALAIPILLHAILDYTTICLTNWYGGSAFELLTPEAEMTDPIILLILTLAFLMIAISLVFIVLLIRTLLKLGTWSREGALQEPLSPAEIAEPARPAAQ